MLFIHLYLENFINILIFFCAQNQGTLKNMYSLENLFIIKLLNLDVIVKKYAWYAQ